MYVFILHEIDFILSNGRELIFQKQQWKTKYKEMTLSLSDIKLQLTQLFKILSLKNKGLLYSTGSYNQSLGINHNGKEYKKRMYKLAKILIFF